MDLPVVPTMQKENYSDFVKELRVGHGSWLGHEQRPRIITRAREDWTRARCPRGCSLLAQPAAKGLVHNANLPFPAPSPSLCAAWSGGDWVRYRRRADEMWSGGRTASEV